MNNKYLNIDGLTEYDALIKNFVNSKVFIGTQDEYETANNNGKIPVDALVIITDDNATSGNGTSGGAVNLSNYYTKTEVDNKLNTKVNNSMLQDFALSVESTYATKTDTYTKDEVDNKIANIEVSGGGSSSTYERITETINLTAPNADSNCQTLYVKVDEEVLPGDKETIGIFADNYEVVFWGEGLIEINGVSQFSCEMVETNVYSFALPIAMAGAYIVPETYTSNRAYFVDRVEAETKAPLGKDYEYIVNLERADVEIDINKVYDLNAATWDNQLKPCFVLTDNGKPLELDKVYTLKVLNFWLPQWIEEDSVNIAELFRAKLQYGLTESGIGQGRTFAYSSENAEVLDVGNCYLKAGFDISGLVEINFYCDDSATCNVVLSPFATAEW